MGKWKLWPPVKSKPLNRLTHNLSGLITSTRGTFVPNLVKIRFVRLFIYLFIYLFNFFSRTNVENRPLDGFWRAMAQKTRNRARMCLFGVIKWKIEIWPLCSPHHEITEIPKTLKIRPWIVNFQPKWWNMKLQVYQKVLNQSRWKFSTMLGT